MGTNYYWYPRVAPAICPTCGRERSREDALHVGKSSAGWCFSLHVIPEHGINSLADWRARWASGGEIVNEYEERITTETMIAVITERKSNGSLFGNPKEDQFHEANDSERGPNGLLRHRIGRYCIGHGDGTYDLYSWRVLMNDVDIQPHSFLPCTDEGRHLFAIDHPHCGEPGCGRPPEHPIHAEGAAERAA